MKKSKNGLVHDLGHHGPKSKAPAELGRILVSLFEIVQPGARFVVEVVDKQLSPSELVVKPVRIEGRSIALKCWPINNNSVGGRLCFVRFTDNTAYERVFEALTELVNNYNLNRNTWPIFLRERGLSDPVEGFWGEERLEELTSSVLLTLINKTPGAIPNVLHRMIGNDATNHARLRKHLLFLQKNGWLKIKQHGRSHSFLITPGQEMARRIAIETGGVPADATDEHFNEYIARGRWIAEERASAMRTLASHSQLLAKARKRLERAEVEYEAASSVVAQFEQEISQAERDYAAANDITLESHPILKRMCDEFESGQLTMAD